MVQTDLEHWLEYYDNERTHQGKMCCGRTPMATLEDGNIICEEKLWLEFNLTDTISKSVSVRSNMNYFRLGEV